jgi:endonuclease YncB( thermonuclease family)
VAAAAEELGLGARALLYALPIVALILLYAAVLLLPRWTRRFRQRGETCLGRVLRVESGKLLTVQIGQRPEQVALAHIALAEDVHDAEAHAQALLTTLLEGREVRLRIIARHAAGIIARIEQPLDAAAELIRKGLCYARTDAPESYRALQEAAIRDGSGLWKTVAEKERKPGTTRIGR